MINCRTSIDTFYVGINPYSDLNTEFVDKIVAYLRKFHGYNLKYQKIGNRFYKTGYISADKAVNIFTDKRDNLLNDEITIELNGKFFRQMQSLTFIDFLINQDAYVNIHRVDACLDILLKDYEPLPKMDYKDDYPYRKMMFEIYERQINSEPFINMMSIGKREIKTKIYDKSLDIFEKEKGKTYFDVYGVKAGQVYRIETMVRSKKIKDMVSDMKLRDIEISSKSLINEILSYTFSKFKFGNYDFSNMYEITLQNATIRGQNQEVNLYERKAWYLRNAKAYVDKAIKVSEEIEAINKYLNEINKIISDKKFYITDDRVKDKYVRCPSKQVLERLLNGEILFENVDLNADDTIPF